MPRIKTSIPETIPVDLIKMSAEKKPGRVLVASLVLNFILTSLVGVALSQAAVRFAIVKGPEVSIFASNYRKVEIAAKQASSDVLKEWVSSNRVK